MELEVLISTLNQKDEYFYTSLFKNCDKFPAILVINQIPDAYSPLSEKEKPITKSGTSISWINLKGKGLGVSRNVAIKNACADIGVVTDDDVVFMKGFEQKVLFYHKQYNKYDIIIFRAVTQDGSPFRKYPLKMEEVTRKIAGGVSSIEITFKVSSVREKNLLFDERFGLGSKYPAGEEWIFLTDALKKGMRVLFVPENIVIHRKVNSGTRFTKQRIIALGATMYRVYGGLAYLRYLIFVKNIRRFHLEFHSFIPFFYFLLKGIIQCQTEHE